MSRSAVEFRHLHGVELASVPDTSKRKEMRPEHRRGQTIALRGHGRSRAPAAAVEHLTSGELTLGKPMPTALELRVPPQKK